MSYKVPWPFAGTATGIYTKTSQLLHLLWAGTGEILFVDPERDSNRQVVVAGADLPHPCVQSTATGRRA